MNLHQYSLSTVMLASVSLSQKLIAYSVYEETELTASVASFMTAIRNTEELFKTDFTPHQDDARLIKHRKLIDVTKKAQADLIFERFDYWQAEILEIVDTLARLNQHICQFGLNFNYQSAPSVAAQSHWADIGYLINQVYKYLEELKRKCFYVEPTNEEYAKAYDEWKELKNKIGLQGGTVFKLDSYSLNGLN